MDAICTASVERLGDATYRITWDERFSADPVTIRAERQGRVRSDAEVVAERAQGATDVKVSAADARWYFRLDAADGHSLVVGERGVALERGVNFRDMGGYATADGRRVRWGRLFRSGHLSHLTAADRDSVAGLGITTVCDFRHESELAHENATLPGAPTVHVAGITPGVGSGRMLHELFARSSDPADTVEAMHRIMAYLAREAAPHYQTLFDGLLGCTSGAFLMNCSGGKERSGLGAALTLAALGVPRETIRYDFMLTGRYMPVEAEVPRTIEKYDVDLPFEQGRALILPILESRESYLAAALEAIEADHGSIDAFLRERFGLDDAARARLGELYLD